MQVFGTLSSIFNGSFWENVNVSLWLLAVSYFYKNPPLPIYGSVLNTPLSDLTLSWRGFLSCRNQSIDLVYKSMDWFLYNRDFHQERVKRKIRLTFDLIPTNEQRKLIESITIKWYTHCENLLPKEKNLNLFFIVVSKILIRIE